MTHDPHLLGRADDPASGDMDGYVFSDQIGHLLRRAYQRHLAIFQAHATDGQITSTQFVTLCTLRDRGPSNQTDMVRATGIDQATIRGIIERLRHRGLLEFEADPADRRKVIVALTPQGAELLDQMIPAAKRISEATMGELNPAERVAITFVLRKMLAQD